MRGFDFHEVWVALPLLWRHAVPLLTLFGILGGLRSG